jgi:hypothetical protein
MEQLKMCPFCGADVNTDLEWMGVRYNGMIGKWVFSHWCNQKDATDGVFITVYGNSKQDVIDKWNGEHEEQTSESL